MEQYNTAFIWACLTNNLQVADLLLANGANINVRRGGEISENPLSNACYHGNLDVVKWLVSKGADITIASNDPLKSACVCGHLEIVKYLLEQGVNPKGNRCLSMACFSGNREIVSLLLNYGCDPTEYNNSPLKYAIETSIDIVRLILESSNEIDVEDAIQKVVRDDIRQLLMQYKYRVDGQEYKRLKDEISPKE